MSKKIGNIEVKTTNGFTKDAWHDITVHYNNHLKGTIVIRGYDALLDLEYIIKTIKRKIKENETISRVFNK